MVESRNVIDQGVEKLVEQVLDTLKSRPAGMDSGDLRYAMQQAAGLSTRELLIVSRVDRFMNFLAKYSRRGVWSMELDGRCYPPSSLACRSRETLRVR